MTQIPANTVTVQDLVEWQQTKEQLAKLKSKEALLRSKIFNAYFPKPVEGTNTAPLANNWVIKGVYGYNRDIDMGQFNALKEVFVAHNFNGDELLKTEYSLIKSAYNKLTAEQQKLFDQCLIIKPATPTLEIVLPKKAASTQPPTNQEQL